MHFSRITPLLVSVIFMVLLTGVFSSTATAEKFAGEFMALGGGARAMGMGGAFSAIANDASTVFWNPAGISGFDQRQILLMHSERFGQLLNYNFATYVMPTQLLKADQDASFGFGLIHLGADDIPVTNNLVYEERNGIPGFQPNDGDVLDYDTDLIPYESHNDVALFGSFAFKSEYGRIGGSLKLIYSDAIAGYSSTGIGIDLGFLRRDVLSGLDVGVKLQDITGTYPSWSSGTNEFIAPSVRVGTAYQVDSDALRGSLLLAMDGHFFFENRQNASQFWLGSTSADIHLGGELRFQDKVMIRGGLDSGYPTAGAGVRFLFLGFDYAYLHHDDFEATHRVSALANF